jgi:hypothetical protein|tara:strand:- start:1003 stop:1308 length:306 start_codon:yes stop_codon:yes gene_type:complete
MATLVGVVASSKKYTSGVQTINGYIGTTSDKFCTGVTSATTVYNSTYTSIANAFTNNSSIYSNLGLSTLASAGYYGDTSGGSGQTNYYWNGTGWGKATSCK